MSACPKCGKPLEPLRHDKRDWAVIVNNRAHVDTCCDWKAVFRVRDQLAADKKASEPTGEA